MSSAGKRFCGSKKMCVCGYTNDSLFQMMKHTRICPLAFSRKKSSHRTVSTNAIKERVVLSKQSVADIKVCPHCQMDLSSMIPNLVYSHLQGHFDIY
jgi:hypothetical protein